MTCADAPAGAAEGDTLGVGVGTGADHALPGATRRYEAAIKAAAGTVDRMVVTTTRPAS